MELFILLAIYFLPTIMAFGKPSVWSIFILNLFLGWTFLGWVIALSMAAAPVKQGA